MSDMVEADPGSAVTLMEKAQRGDREAFAELQRRGDERGVSYTADWSSSLLRFRPMARASPAYLLARASVEADLEATIRELSDSRDGPIERLLVDRAAVCVADVGMSDLEHLRVMEHYDDPGDAEPFDRRRDRAQRRLLATLSTLTAVRRMSRPALRLTQISLTTDGGKGSEL
jgi:hypothetical protein